MIGEHGLKRLRKVAATILDDGSEYRRQFKRFRRVRESDGVVENRRRIHVSRVGELEWLVVDRDEDGILWSEQRVETDFAFFCHE